MEPWIFGALLTLCIHNSTVENEDHPIVALVRFTLALGLAIMVTRLVY